MSGSRSGSGNRYICDFQRLLDRHTGMQAMMGYGSHADYSLVYLASYLAQSL